MEIHIDPRAVNQLVADAVLKSALGEAVKKAVEKEVANLTRGWDNPLESVIRNHLAQMARDVLVAEHQETLRAKLTEALSAKLSAEFIDRVCEAAASKYA